MEQGTFRPRRGREITVVRGSEQGWLKLVSTLDMSLEYVDQRVANLSSFHFLTKNLPNFKVPKTRKLIDEIEVKEAHGIPLDSHDRNNADTIAFFSITTLHKLEALRIYLEAIKTINDNNRLVGDHNTDGIFIEIENGQTVVWSVDPGMIDQIPKDNVNLYNAEISDPLNGADTGLLGLLAYFFDQNIEEDCIPKSLRLYKKEDIRNITIIDIINAVNSVTNEELEKAESSRKRLLKVLNKASDIPPEENELSLLEFIKLRDNMYQKFIDIIKAKQLDLAKDTLQHIVLKTLINSKKIINIQDECKFWIKLSEEANENGFGGNASYKAYDTPLSLHNFHQMIFLVVYSLNTDQFNEAIFTIAQNLKLAPNFKS